MENFKECFQDDLENAFFDVDEFASIHIIDGEKCSAVLIETSLLESKMPYGSRRMNPKETAINKVTHILFVRESELKRKITSNSLIVLDGKKLFVQSVKKTAGVCKLELGINAV